MKEQSKFTQIHEALLEQEGVNVLGYREDEPIFNGRKGTLRRPTHIYVAPSEGYSSVADLNDFSTQLLPEVEHVFRHDAQVKTDKDGNILAYGKLRSFERLGEREVQTIEIEIQPSSESKVRL